MTTKPILFWLGATGYVGSETLMTLNKYLPKPDSYHIIALVRNSTPQIEAALKKLYSDLAVVNGSLDDLALIQTTSEKADVVINSADSTHAPSVKAILAGLTARAKANPSAPAPIFLHVSGDTMLSDRVNGAYVKNPKVWSDKDFDVTTIAKDSVHMNCEIPIAEAGRRTDHPLRTVVLDTALIYGVGNGIQRTTPWLRDWIAKTKQAGHCGTWGDGFNSLDHVHIHDAVAALLTLLRATLNGEVKGGGKDSNYFTGSSRVEMKALAAATGDGLYKKQLAKEAGSRPWPTEITGPKGNVWWFMYGGNHLTAPYRLPALGWKPTETLKQGPIDNLPAAIDVATEKHVN